MPGRRTPETARCRGRRWRELTPGRRRLIVVTGAAQVTLLLAALASIARTPPGDVRGPKWAWMLGAFVNWVGPLGWFALGRRRERAPRGQ